MQPCGGRGACLPASATCTCFRLYAGDACQYCAEGARRTGDVCVPVVSVTLAQDGGTHWAIQVWWLWLLLTGLAVAMLGTLVFFYGRSKIAVVRRRSTAAHVSGPGEHKEKKRLFGKGRDGSKRRDVFGGLDLSTDTAAPSTPLPPVGAGGAQAAAMAVQWQADEVSAMSPADAVRRKSSFGGGGILVRSCLQFASLPFQVYHLGRPFLLRAQCRAWLLPAHAVCVATGADGADEPDRPHAELDAPAAHRWRECSARAA